MPTYEYKCSACDNQYEKHEGFDAPSRQPCPRCGGQARRMLFPPPIVFKGSGFYVTDSRKGSTATVGEHTGIGAATPSESKGDSTDGAKPAASTSTTSSNGDSAKE